MENRDLSQKIKNSLQKLEIMIENKECALKINEEKEKLNSLLEEYCRNMK